MKDKQDKHAQFVDIADLRIGLYIYLDLGWMDHPFALNSFRISTQEQINTIRGLGLLRVRYSPEQSNAPAAAGGMPAGSGRSIATPATSPEAGVPPLAGAAAAVAAAPAAGAGTAQSTSNEPTATAPDAAAPDVTAAMAADPMVAAAVSKQHRRELIAAQHAGIQRCENQFADASRDYRKIVEQMHSRPQEAREHCEVMVGALLEQIGGARESYVRLLSEKAGEKTSLHSINVMIISLLLGKALQLPPEDMTALGMGALLHDIGKLGLPDRLRWGDEGLNAAERQLYRGHVESGLTLANKMGLTAQTRLIVAQHHEHEDGSGYPKKLAGDKLTQAARIVALVNYYDNLCNPGNPSAAVTPHEALSLIFAQMKRQFEARTLSMFIRMMGVYPPGSVVELSDGRFAMVVSVNSSRPLRPSIVIHDKSVPAEEALVVNLEDEPALGIQRSIKPLQLPKASFDYLSPRKRLCYFFERGSDPDAGMAE